MISVSIYLITHRVTQHRESSKDSDILVPKGYMWAFCSK